MSAIAKQMFASHRTELVRKKKKQPHPNQTEVTTRGRRSDGQKGRPDGPDEVLFFLRRAIRAISTATPQANNRQYPHALFLEALLWKIRVASL